jgi:hypothetical protein
MTAHEPSSRGSSNRNGFGRARLTWGSALAGMMPITRAMSPSSVSTTQRAIRDGPESPARIPWRELCPVEAGRAPGNAKRSTSSPLSVSLAADGLPAEGPSGIRADGVRAERRLPNRPVRL